MKQQNAARNVWYLGLVSLFTEISSQMIYPFIPQFLVSIGASKSIIGLVEGIAEATASLFRTVFGRWSDRVKRRKIFIFCGYGLSALSKPFLYLAQTWTAVLTVRFSDRMGKAMRNPARDALISTSISVNRKGRAFGIHRGMDRLGAIGGPLLALLVLHFFEDNVRWVFLLSVVPGLLALIFIIFAREMRAATQNALANPGSGESGNTTGLKQKGFLLFLLANIVFTLGNSSNAFLILKAHEAGLAVALIPVIWIVYNLFCTLSSPVFGIVSDRVGRQPVIASSFLYYAVLYLLFGIAGSVWQVWALFAAYGVYYGLSEGVLRAYIADLVEEESRSTAYGIFNTGIGIALLPASVIMGLIWDAFGSRWAFFTSAGFSLVGFFIFLISIHFHRRAGQKYSSQESEAFL